MAEFITLPQYRNPWVQNLPNMLQNMTLQTMAQKFKGKQIEEDRKIREYESNTKTFVRYQKTPDGGFQPVLMSQAPGQSFPQSVKMGAATSPKAPKVTDAQKLELNEAKLAQQLQKQKDIALFKEGLEEITIFNPEKGLSRKVTRNQWVDAQKQGVSQGWTETKKEKALMSEAELTRKALGGDAEAKAILEAMQERKIKIAEAQGLAAMDAKLGVIDIPATAQSILDGRENMENVKNTFGVAVQEAVRKEVLAKDPKFNFLKPRVKLAGIKSSLMQQEKQHGMMGSFVKNLDKQLLRTDAVMNDVISRVGVRALDLPIRELRTRFVGSGHEKVLEAYLIEISNEIGKLSTGSAASVRELSTEAQQRWSKIHDPNLSLKELQKILDETQLMGQMRLESTEEQIEETMQQLTNIRKPTKYRRNKKKPTSRFRILKVD